MSPMTEAAACWCFGACSKASGERLIPRFGANQDGLGSSSKLSCLALVEDVIRPGSGCHALCASIARIECVGRCSRCALVIQTFKRNVDGASKYEVSGLESSAKPGHPDTESCWRHCMPT